MAPIGSLQRHKIGLGEFLKVADILMKLCAKDANNLPQIPPSEIKAMGIEADLEFYDLLAYYLGEVRNSIIIKRNAESAKT
jgi:hypothetical protein|tara:strand:- start:3168 stop:3410 length:243 start_codon:yes stop_codon:yes gene_type:complete